MNARGLWPQYEGTFPSDQTAGPTTPRSITSSSHGQSLFFRYGAEDEYRPIITAGGSDRAERQLRLRGAAQVGGARAHLGDQRSRAERRSASSTRTRSTRCRRRTATATGSRPTSAARLPLCTPVFTLSVDHASAAAATRRWARRSRWELKDDFSYLMRDWGGTHQWKMGFDFSSIPFEGDNIGSPLGSWTFPRDVPYNATDPTTYPTQYTNSLPTYANIPTKTFAGYLQDDWQVGQRPDVQPRAALRPADGIVQRGRAGPAREDPGQARTRRLVPAATSRSSRSRKPAAATSTTSDRASAWRGIRPNNGVTNIHAAYGHVLRQHADAAELRRADVAAGQADHHHAADVSRSATAASRASRSSPTAPPNITVESNDTVNPYAHQFNAGVSRTVARDIAVTADVSLTNRYSDRDTIDPNLPDQSDARPSCTRSSRASTSGCRRPTTPTARCC